jgi:rhamnulokinase
MVARRRRRSLDPVVTPEAMEANFTNEGGFGDTTRFLKNVMGLWLLQECRRTWAREGREYSYAELTRLAEGAPAVGPLVDPDHPTFLHPGDMPSRIRRFCEETRAETARGSCGGGAVRVREPGTQVPVRH